MMKKMVSMLLVLAMALGMSGTALAAGNADEGIMPLTEYMVCPKCGASNCVVQYVQGVRVESHSCGYYRSFNDTTLNVPFHKQEAGNTCSCASIRMILAFYGINVTESEIQKTGGTDFNVVYKMANTLNQYLSANGKTFRYTYTSGVSSMTEASYRALIFANLLKGYPLIVNIKTSSASTFPYVSGGHYIVIKGMRFNTTTNVYDLIINDPHDRHPAENFVVPLSEVFQLNKAGNNHLIRVVAG